MATYGWQPQFVDNWVYFGFNNSNNVATGPVAFPGSGTVSAIVFACALLSGSGGPMAAQGCLWDSSGDLLVAGASLPLPAAGAGGGGPYAWNVSGCSYHLTAGTVVRMGWWRNPAAAAGDNLIGFGQGSTSWLHTTAASTGPGGFSNDSSFGGQIGVYVIYTPDAPTPAPAPAPTPTEDAAAMRNTYTLMQAGALPR